MAGFSEIRTFRPRGRKTLEELAADLDLSISDKSRLENQGLKQIMTSKNLTCFDMLNYLLEKSSFLIDKSDIDCIVYAHALQSHPNMHYFFEKIKNQHGLEGIPIFDVSDLNCASSIMAIKIANERLKHSSKNKVLLLFAEKCYSHELRVISNISIISDAAALCIIDKNSKSNEIININQFIDGKVFQEDNMDEDTYRWFQISYFLGIKKVITQSLKMVNRTLSDISLIIPHNVNKQTWEYVSQSLRLPDSKIYTNNIEDLGHANTCDIFINAEDIYQSNQLKKGDLYFMLSIGLGGAYSCILLRR